MIKTMLIMSATLLALSGHAGLSSDMNDFFESSGMQTNVTGPGAYQGQTAGLYTGGQLYARNQVKMVYPANISLPSYSAGCGGIDAFTGAFSFISGDELMDSMEAIATNATSYAFMLAMETVSPQLSGVQKHLSNLVNTVNRANINSCETASSLVGGLWPKTEVAQNQICASAGVSGGFLDDWAQAKQGCSKGGTSAMLEKSKTKNTHGDLIMQNKNIGWETLKKSKLINLDLETREILMSMAGTIIVKNVSIGNDNEGNHVIYKQSRVTDRDFIKALLYGGEVDVYKCNESNLCLDPSQAKIKITTKNSFVDMVTNMLNSIHDAIVSDTALNDNQINFLGSTTLPIYKMFNVEYGMGGGSNILNINGYAELIATDILYQYLSENLEMMLSASQSLALGEEYMDQYRGSISMARKYLTEQRNDTRLSINETMNVIQNTRLLEQALAGKLSSHMVNIIGTDSGW